MSSAIAIGSSRPAVDAAPDPILIFPNASDEERAIIISSRRIAATMERRGMSRKQLCQKAGLSQGALSEILAGKALISTAKLASVSRALGVSASYIIGF